MTISEQLRDISASVDRGRPDAPCAGEVGRSLSRLFRVAGKAKGHMFGSGQLGGVDWSGSIRLGPIRVKSIRPGPVKNLAD